ncbi:dihydrolipoyl dehydrogenase [Desemzia incerta]|uniref:dihydrolipoyl dehydrogenase n=1 Tax=Desemzia incerta TaxID=82801 RepID=UPI001660BE35|nr:dihydrolipoyl dehydrogenase [Desemzia incerta]
MSKKETVIIGSGPGGYVSAIRAAQLGQKVTIIEKTYIGGTCLNVGCIPSKAIITAAHAFHNAKNSEIFGVQTGSAQIDLEKTQDWKENQVVKRLTGGVESLLKKNKVEIIRGTASFKDNKHLMVTKEDGSTEELEFQQAVISTGTAPIELAEVPFGEKVIDTTGGLGLRKAPESLVIVGGGYVGSQLAGAFSNLGVKVTILEKESHILHFFDEDMSKMVEKNYAKKGIEVITSVNIKSTKETADDVAITYEKDGKEETITSSAVLVSAGRKPYTKGLNLEEIGVEMLENGLIKVSDSLQTSVEGIYAIGDVAPGPAFAHKASYEGKIVAEVIAGQNPALEEEILPIAVYTEPELATVGISAAAAKKSDRNLKISKFPLAGNGRALSLNQTEGFVRLITDQDNDNALVGAQIAGVGAPDIISEVGFAIKNGMNAEDISLTVHAHPTVAESIMDASELALGMPIHM